MNNINEQSFWEHLEEFRYMLIKLILAIVIFTIISFIFMPYLFDHIIMAPTQSDFLLYKYLCKVTQFIPFIPNFCNDLFHVDIINIKLASQLLTQMSTSFWLSLILTFPYLVYEVWRFVKPALYKREKNKTKKAFISGTILFFIGCTFGYTIVFPLILHFLAEYSLSETIENQISLDSYMENFLMLIFIMGLIFEFPVIAWLLSKLGILNKSIFKKYRRYAIVILLILAAFITPSSDPFTLFIVFLPLYILYELSYLLVHSE